MMLGLLTNNEHPSLTNDDQLLVKALIEKNVPYQIVNWNTHLPDSQITHLLIRSPWDYYLYPHKFLTYLKDCETRGVKVLNSLATVEWNYKKHYLKELEAKKLPIVESTFFSPDTQMSQITLAAQHLKKVVIKPAISGSSYLTYLTSPLSPEFEPQCEKILQHGDLVLQPYLPSIKESGEISVIYFKNKKPEYSHTVHKLPKTGDFRVQNDFGGSSVYLDPPESIKEFCEHVLTLIQQDWLYVRVDLVDWENKPLISEIELIEPALYFLQHPPAANHLAQILKDLA